MIANPADPRGLAPGEVLVCAITDPSWTPLFLTRRRSCATPARCRATPSIVARELGIPAVMSVPGITAVADGTMLQVDGAAASSRSADPPPCEVAGDPPDGTMHG